MATVVHVEIPADDIDRAKKFYSELFGWKIEQIPEMEYWLFTMEKTAGREKPIGGGMTKRMTPQQTVTNYFNVPSVDDHSSKVEKLGGKMVVHKTAVPGMGYFAVCVDTENNVFGLWEDNMEAK